MGAVTIGFYFDGRMSKDGEFYLKYAVYYTGKQKYFSTGVKLDKEDVLFLKKYKSGLTGGVRDEYRRNLWNMVYGQSYINELTRKEEPSYLRKAETIAARLADQFSFEEFSRQIKGPGIEIVKSVFSNNIIGDLLEKSQELAKSENLTDSNLFECTNKSLIRFLKGKETLPYSMVTKDFLKDYQKWMLIEGKKSKKKKGGKDTPASISTIGIYTMHIRTIFNEKIAAGLIPESLYPFGKAGYKIPSARNIKKALSKDDVIKIINYKIEDNVLMERSRDLWIFSYLCNGMNFADIFNLKWTDLDKRNDTITFTRKKTESTKITNDIKIQVDLFPISWDIINKWGQPNGLYIFPVYDKEMDAERKRAVKSQAIKITNMHMKTISQELEISIDVKTYAARHSFATILLQSEAPLAFISGKLGHRSITTTQLYFGSFEDKKVKKYLSALLPDEPGEPKEEGNSTSSQ